MLPGIINQVSLDWDASINYYLPTLKRYEGKLYMWAQPSGPNLGGSHVPDVSPEYWMLVDFMVNPRVTIKQDILDWNDMKFDGKFLMRSILNESVNPPENVTAWWWLEVSTCAIENKLQVLQVARLHPGSDMPGTLSSKVLSRAFDGNETWSNWSYDYTQYYG